MTTTLPLLPETGAAPDDRGLGMLTCDEGWLPLTAVDVDAGVSGLNASVTVRQSFHNPFSQAIEATYIYPLPDRAAVTAFTVTIGDRTIEGRLEERGKARATYDEAIAAGHRAAITEEERPDVFTTRVGNLQPGERADVELTLAQPLPWEDGQATFRFPLVVAPRYIPGRPLDGEPVGDGVGLDTDAVPDASRVTPPVMLPGLPNPVRLGLRVRFGRGPLPAGIAASLHTIVESGAASDGGEAEVALQPGERLDRDFVLRWAAGGGDGPATMLALAPDREQDGGTFTFTVLPPAGGPVDRPRDVVVVLDRSGSMGGWKMVAARRAAARIIDSLSGADRFSVLAFDNAIDRPPRLAAGLVPASDRNRWLAVEWLAGLEARGGTELAAPLSEALAALGREAGEDRQPSCLVVTDGQIGNEDQVLAELAPAVLDTRIFTIGIDRAVNSGFLQRLAALGAGRCELVESEDRLDEVMAAVHRRIATPVLQSVELEAASGDIGQLTPARAVDCFAGVPLVVRGRYQGSAQDLRWSATGASGSPAGGTTRGVEAVDPAARPLWARARIRDLEDDYATARHDHGIDREGLAARIVELSLSTGVLSRFTAFVAVDLSQQVGTASPLTVVQPVELPSGWDASLTAAPSPAPGGTAQPSMPAGPVAEAMPAQSSMPAGPVAEAMPARPLLAPPPLAAPAVARPAAFPQGAARHRLPIVAPPPGPVPPARQVPSLDLTRYLVRLEDLLVRVVSGETGPSVARELGDLLGDLRSVDAPEPLVTVVDRLLAEVRAGQSVPAESVAAVREAIVAARLPAPGPDQAGPAAGTRRRGRRFWR